MWKGIKLTKEGQKQTALSAARQRLMEVERINSLITERFEQEDIPEEPVRLVFNRIIIWLVTNPQVSLYREKLFQLLRARHYINVPPRSFCDDRDFVVVVHSRLNDLETRSNWRRTYGSFQAMYRFALVFVVGRASTIEEKASLGSEVNIHEDILEVDFNDTYRNLTLKLNSRVQNIAALRYVLVACPEVPTVLKMDDDVAWNMEKAAKLANFTAATNKIHCSLHVTYEEWSENVFPPYCYGLAYTIPRQGIIRVLQALQTQKFLWVPVSNIE
ncbi:N-acetyllactosaminide 3-alpha-galactosyltransferase [Ancylostoma ceylanicum]|uniref:Hexosyltransferase n=1 Tax=Ancylostoma ceylanicum TaxID=53326 RepID=A0A0D6L7R7_9BILA|nr:N-acetyllactosaminide 3-alpha-galactosyltransferase [Ancylostoma ceylanicum]